MTMTLSTTNFHVTDVMGISSFFEKVGVTATYVALGLGHAIEGASIRAVAPWSRRASTNLLASKIAFYSLWAFTRNPSSPYYNTFRFHHLSYGLAFMLLPGRASRFGKWIVFDSCVDYNDLGVFNRLYHFVEMSPGVFDFVPGITDGVLNEVGYQDGLHVFPADNFFASNSGKFLREIFLPCEDTTLLDKATECTNFLVDKLVIPYIAELEKDPSKPQLKIGVDFSLFKA